MILLISLLEVEKDCVVDDTEGQMALALLVELEKFLGLEFVVDQSSLVREKNLVVTSLGLGVEVGGQTFEVRLLLGQSCEVLFEVLVQEFK